MSSKVRGKVNEKKRAPAAKTVPDELDGRFVDAVVRSLYDVSWGDARAWIARGAVRVDGAVMTQATTTVHKGATVTIELNAPRRRAPHEISKERIAHIDAHVVVVNKPPGVSSIAFDEKETGTLDEKVRDYLSATTRGAKGRPSLGVVHRLDKETSGLMVFTRTWLAKQSLTSQFRAHTVEREYLAIVHGNIRSQTITSHIVADRGDGLRGSIEAMRNRLGRGAEGQLAVTHIEAIEKLQGATLIKCRLETGRTHQIRIHLSEAGHPIVGERVYIRGFTGEAIEAPRVMLHAARLGFVHPVGDKEVHWEEPMPSDMAAVYAALRA